MLVGFNFFRSLEHIFNEDGGAESIAGIPLSTYSTEAAANIVAIFAQWEFFSISFIIFFVTHSYKNERTHTTYVDYCCFGEYFKRRGWVLKSLILEDAPPGAVSLILGLVTLAVFFISIKDN